MTVSARYVGQNIIVSSDFRYRDACKSVPCRTWVEKDKVWKYTATPRVAARLLAALNFTASRLGDTETKFGADFVKLAESAVDVSAFVRGYDLAAGGDDALGGAWDHQRIGESLIAGARAVYLGWEMGTGKTKAVLAAIARLRPARVLVVCPSSVVAVWPKQIAVHYSKELRERVIMPDLFEKPIPKRAMLLSAAFTQASREGRTAIVVTNYEAFSRADSPLTTAAITGGIDVLVLDEAHRLSSPAARMTRAVTTIAKTARRVVALSGTPIRNSPLDVFSQCRALDPGIFGSNQFEFLEHFSIRNAFGKVVRAKNENELADRLATVVYSVKKRDVLHGLPPVTISERTFALGPEGLRVYNLVEKTLAAEIGGGNVSVSNAIVKLLRLQQITSGYVPTETADEATGLSTQRIERLDTGKRDSAAEWVDEIAADEPVVFFCRFRYDLDSIAEIARGSGRGVYELSGRKNELAAWQAAKGGEILAVQIQSGGLGVDLTRAAYAGFYSVGYSLADYEQAMARLDRPGQTRPVTLTNFVAAGTVDETVFGAIASKANVAEAVIARVRAASTAANEPAGAT